VPNEQTRRTFLKLSAVGLTATATPNLTSALTPSPAPAGEITVRVTSGKLRYASAESLTWRTAGNPAENAIVLDPGKKFQEMLGFGAAFTDAACYMFNQLPAPARDELFHELFHPAEMGLGVCRTCIGSSDYSTEVFSYDEGEPDAEMTRFSIAHDQAYVLPMLRLARKANPNLFLFSSPWSPPGWMKAGGSMLGGSVRQRCFGPYAQYFVKFLQAYAGEGVPVQAVTVQNEVDTDQDGRMPACLFPQEYEIGFVKNHLGPLLRQNGLSTKIWILDHNYNLWGRAICELDDEDLRKYCDAVAFPRRTMRPIGRTGGKPSRRRVVTGARRSAAGIWRSTKKGGRTLGRFPAAGWSRFILERRRLRVAVSTGRLRISRATCGVGLSGSNPLAKSRV